jgi:hypothetical protein
LANYLGRHVRAFADEAVIMTEVELLYDKGGRDVKSK